MMPEAPWWCTSRTDPHSDAPSMKEDSGVSKDRRNKKRVMLLAVVVIAIATAWSIRALGYFDLEPVVAYVHRYPTFGLLVFLVVYVASMVFLIPTIPCNMAAGIIWGAVGGGILSAVAATIGACVSFNLARLGIGALSQRQADGDFISWVLREFETTPLRALAVLRLTPGIPTGPLNYAIGLTNVRFSVYAVATFIFFIPPGILMAGIGEAAGSFAMTGELAATWQAASVAGVAFVTLLVMWAFIRRRKTDSDRGGRV